MVFPPDVLQANTLQGSPLYYLLPEAVFPRGCYLFYFNPVIHRGVLWIWNVLRSPKVHCPKREVEKPVKNLKIPKHEGQSNLYVKMVP